MVERRKVNLVCFGVSTSHCQVLDLGSIRSHLTVTALSRYSHPTSPKRVTVDPSRSLNTQVAPDLGSRYPRAPDNRRPPPCYGRLLSWT